MTRIAAVVAIAMLSAQPVGASADADLARVERPPHLGLQAYDLLLLRPLGLAQLAVGVVALVPSYPIAWFLDGQDEVVRACVTDPARRTFARPLGKL